MEAIKYARKHLSKFDTDKDQFNTIQKALGLLKNKRDDREKLDTYQVINY
jgi:hypothetical protein